MHDNKNIICCKRKKRKTTSIVLHLHSICSSLITYFLFFYQYRCQQEDSYMHMTFKKQKIEIYLQNLLTNDYWKPHHSLLWLICLVTLKRTDTSTCFLFIIFENNRTSCFIHNDNILMKKWRTTSHLLTSKYECIFLFSLT
jgi:hypothetical protein